MLSGLLLLVLLRVLCVCCVWVWVWVWVWFSHGPRTTTHHVEVSEPPARVAQESGPNLSHSSR